MQTIKQNLYFLNLSISSKKQNLVIKPFFILFLFFISICPTLYSQDFSNQLNDDSVVVKPDYRNHLNIPEYNPALMPLVGQTSSTGVWTELNPKVPRVDYLGIHFVNKDTGWAVGANGTIIKTTNGGINWSNSNSNTTTPILKIRSYNGQIVIASGYGGTILRSSDGGETFSLIASGVTGDLWGLKMINDTLGWACGISNSLTKTTDGGQTWQRVFIPGYTTSYWWVDFMNENYGFIAADGKVLRTTDGGNNWEIIQAGDAYPLFCIDIIDSLHIAAAGYGGMNYTAKNLYSGDGGNNWITGDTLTTESVNCIQYINPDTGYLIMDERYFRKTTNRGQDWNLIFSEMGEFELQFLINDNIGYSAGTGLQISKSEDNMDIWHRLIINDNFADVFFTNENIGYAIAYRKVLKTITGGENWFYLSAFPTDEFTAALNSLVFTDNLTGYAGGAPCKIAKTTDAGITWYITNRTGLSDTIGTINKIYFINQTTGWALTSRGGILKTTDAGENWFTQLDAEVSVIFSSVCFIDSLIGWTANSNSRPFKTTNGGYTWVLQTNVDIWQSRDIFFANRDTGWIVDNTSWSALKRTTNGGINWIAIPEILNPFEFHFFPDPKHWMINGTPQKYITADGGITWIDITNDAPSGFNSFCSVTDILGYAVGGLGLILKYDDTSYVPVELISFEGIIDAGNITLIWQTASELNNSGFYVEKSYNKTSWETLGFVIGKGTSTELNYYSFIDKEITYGSQYYRLKQIDFDGSFKYSIIIEAMTRPPDKFSLSQNYPNPFNPETNIAYSIGIKTQVNISLFNVTGEKIKEIVNEEKQPGYYTVKLKGGNLSSGIYFYRLFTSSGYTAVKKLTIIK